MLRNTIKWALAVEDSIKIKHNIYKTYNMNCYEFTKLLLAKRYTKKSTYTTKMFFEAVNVPHFNNLMANTSLTDYNHYHKLSEVNYYFMIYKLEKLFSNHSASINLKEEKYKYFTAALDLYTSENNLNDHIKIASYLTKNGQLIYEINVKEYYELCNYRLKFKQLKRYPDI